MALAAYRHILRSTRIAFQGLYCSCARPIDLQASRRQLTTATGDARLLAAARNEARKGFETNSHLLSDSKEATAGIAHAEDVAKILRHNVVQGEQAGEGEEGKLNYSRS